MLKSSVLVLSSVFLCSFIGCTQFSEKLSANKDFTHPKNSRALASLKEDVNALDPNKPTVCALTLNSSDEKEVFSQFLGKKFNFIELTNREENQDGWFMNACRSGVKCDVLLISGHFAGTFFGYSGLKLPLEKLESAACQSQCDGILKHPKEVFLFGCNTLAGKNKDSRTQAEYVRVLIEDGFDREDAERIAAFRYSPVGHTNESRMRRAFNGATKIYGFDSIAPSGNNISGALTTYLKKIGDYREHLNLLNAQSRNETLAKTLTWAPFVESTGWGDVSKSPTCYLGDPNVNNSDKLNWVKDSLTDKHYGLQNIVFIQNYFIEQQDSETIWSAPQKATLKEIQNFSPMKANLEALIKDNLSGSLSIQTAIASLLHHVRWWDDKRYNGYMNSYLDVYFKPTVSDDKIDELCAAGIRLDYLPQSLPKDSLSWTSNTLKILNCLQPSSPDVNNKILEIAKKHADPQQRIMALRSLNTSLRLNRRLQNELIAMLESESEMPIIEQIGYSLAESINVDEASVQRLINILKKPQLFIRPATAADILGALRPVHPSVAQSLYDVMTSNDPGIHMVTKLRAGEALAWLNIKDHAMIKGLIEVIRNNPEYEFKYTAAKILEKASLNNDEQITLAQLAKEGGEYSTRVGGCLALRGSIPLPADIQGLLKEALSEEKDNLVINALRDLVGQRK